MTPEEARIRELPKLIADEKDHEKMIAFAAELERLLRLQLERQKTARIVDQKPPAVVKR
jgi:hypothetical protein